MTDHISQLVSILTSETTGYTINKNISQSIAPSINISYQKPFNPHYSSKDEYYYLQIKATTVENREAIVKSLLQQDSRYPNGYKQAVTHTNTATTYTITEMQSYYLTQMDPDYIFYESQSGNIVGFPTDSEEYKIYFNFPDRDILTTIIFSIYLSSDYDFSGMTYTLKLTSYTFPSNYISLPDILSTDLVANASVWEKVISTDYTGQTPPIEIELSGNDDNSLSLESFFNQPASLYSLEIDATEGYNIQFETSFSLSSGVLLQNEAPYYLEMEMLDEWGTEATILCKARWVV